MSDIHPDIRDAVLRRDQYRCRCCGDPDINALTLHHVVYRSQGGKHGKDNLVTVCWHCHTLIHNKRVTVQRLHGQWFFGDLRHWRNIKRH